LTKIKSKSKEPNPQLVCIFASFCWFATVLEMNKDIEPASPKLLALYKNLARLSLCTEEQRKARIAIIDQAITDLPTADVDFLLLSVTVLAEYYAQSSGSKRFYTPMSNKDILMLQDEVLEGMPKSIWKPTFDFAEQFVSKILNKQKEK